MGRAAVDGLVAGRRFLRGRSCEDGNCVGVWKVRRDFFLIPLKLLGRRDTSGTLRDDASTLKAVQHHSLHMSASLRPSTYLLYVPAHSPKREIDHHHPHPLSCIYISHSHNLPPREGALGAKTLAERSLARHSVTPNKWGESLLQTVSTLPSECSL